MARLQRFGFVLLPGFGLTSLAVAIDTLQAANPQLDDTCYESVLLSPQGGDVQAANGVMLGTVALAQAPALDAVWVVSELPWGEHDRSGSVLLPWLKRLAAGGAMMAGIGSGAAGLAEAGLLQGYRATAHWPHLTSLAQRHIDTVVSQQWFEIDRDRLTCAGHDASRDMLICWLGSRHGERVAQALASTFGIERLRGRDERQHVPLNARPGGGSAKLDEAVSLMQANVAEPLPTEDIARLVGVSRRQLERLFKQHLDALPSRWYLELRLERARRMLRQSSQSILQIGLSCGFASGPHFSNAYRGHFGHTPRDERSQRAAAWRAEPQHAQVHRALPPTSQIKESS